MFSTSHRLARLSPSLPFGKRKHQQQLQSSARTVVEELEDRTLFAALYWDPTGAPTAIGGAGTWNTTTAQWRSGSATGPLVSWNNTANNDAIFPPSTGTITLGAAVSAKSLTFKSTGYLLKGNTLKLTGGAGRIDVPAGATTTINSILAGTTGLNKIDSGTLVLTSANSISGQTIISGGLVKIANSKALQNTTVSLAASGLTFNSGIGSFRLAGLAGGKNLSLNDSAGSPVALILGANGSNSTYSGILTGSGSLKIVAGTQTLSGLNTYTGGTTLSAGQLNLNSVRAIGTGTFTINGGAIDNTSGTPITLKTNNAQIWAGDFTYGAKGTLNLGSGPVTLTANPTLTASQKTLTIGGPISDSGKTFGITKTGAGTLLLNGADSYSGSTIINAGVVQLGNAAALQNSTVVLNATNGLRFSAGISTFNLSGLYGNAAESITGAGAKPITLSLGINGSSSSYSGILSGTGSLALAGGFALLSGNNTYSGGTTINSGALLVNNIAGSGTGAGPVVVNKGATLAGNGTIHGAVTVTTGATFSPGLGGPAIFNTGNLTLASGSNLNIDLYTDTAGTGYDQIKVAGVANIAGSNLILSGTKSTQDGALLDIINATTPLNGRFQGLPQAATTSYNGVTYSANYSGGNGDDFALTAGGALPSLPNVVPVPPALPVPPVASVPSSPTLPPTPPGPLPPAPAVPQNPEIAAPSSAEIDITWTSVDQASSYIVQRSTNGSNGWTTIATPAVASWSDLGLSPSVTFYYRVAAHNAGGSSAYSAAVSTAIFSSTVLTPSISGNPTANHGVVYTLNLSAPNASRFPVDAPVQSWTIDWGDGTPAFPDTMIVPGLSAIANHIYLTDGPETITASAKNPYGVYTASPLTLTVGDAPIVTTFQVNDGSPQRASVNSLTVNFDEPVNLSAAAFQLTETATAAGFPPGPANFQLTPTNGNTTYVLTFPQSSFPADAGDSLPNGTYSLTVLAPQVTDAGGGAMQFNAHFTFDRSADQNGNDTSASFAPTVSLNPVSPAIVGNPVAISAAAETFGHNGDKLSYQWFITDPTNTAITLPGGNITTANAISLIPSSPGAWSVSVVVTDTDLSLSTNSQTQSFNVTSNTTAQSMVASFDSNGLSQLAYAGTVLAGPGTSTKTYPQLMNDVFALELVDANGNPALNTDTTTTAPGIWDASAATESYYFPNPSSPVVTIAVQYVIGLNSLGYNITATNTSPYTLNGFSLQLISQLQFPQKSSAGPLNSSGVSFAGGSQVTFVSDQPSYLAADFGSGALVLGVDQQSPGYLGFSSNTATPTNNTYSINFSTNSFGVTNSSWPVLNSPIPAGTSATYNVNLRFGPTGSAPQLASDYIQTFATQHPFDMQWTDRRPITEIFLSSSSNDSAANPRGWTISSAGLNVTTPAGLNTFSTQLLKYADTEIKMMKSMGSQGMITWDLEGSQYPGADYIGDPTLATTLAPELAYNNLIGQYFAKFRAAGLEVGMTIRPSQIKFFDGQASQQAAVDPAQLLISKIEYAKKEWGATLFYIDSAWSFNTTLYGLAGLLAEVHAAEPDVLLIPEQSPIAAFASAAAYSEIPGNRTLIPGLDAITSIAYQLIYPNAFTVIRSDKGKTVGEADVPALTEGIARGDSYFLQGTNTAVKEAFDRIALQDAYTGSQIYNNDTFVLRLFTPTDPAQAEYQISRNGLIIDSFPVTTTPSLNFHFTGANENLIIDTTTGSPIPTSGLTIDGANPANNNTLSIVGPLAPAAINPGAGSVTIGTGRISFTHLATALTNPLAASPMLMIAATPALTTHRNITPAYTMTDWYDADSHYDNLFKDPDDPNQTRTPNLQGILQ